MLPLSILLSTAAVFVAIERGAVQAQPVQPGPKQWDYKVLGMGLVDVKVMEDKLREAGGQGWECVSTTSVVDKNGSIAFYFTMKKPR
jgi:hypothetical protein